MIWRALLFSPTPPELLAKLPGRPATERLALVGESDGKGLPAYFNWPKGKPLTVGNLWVALLQEAWQEGYGPTGTGCIGQVRDMLWVMATVAKANGLRLLVPAATRRKAQEEAEADAAALPEGAVF